MGVSTSSAFTQDLTTQQLLGVIDSIPEVSGMGCYVVVEGQVIKLRNANALKSSVVVEVRPPVSQGGGRGPSSSAPGEWIGFGFSCTGMVIAWIGVIGTAAAAPVTGGASAVGTAFLWGGAMAATAQCGVSGYRINNVLRNNDAGNEMLDNNQTYVWSMRGLDALGLVTAFGAFAEVRSTYAALEEADMSFGDALGPLTRRERLVLTEALELQGARRVAAISINNVVKQRLLDGIGGLVGIGGSSVGTGGVVHDVVVWVVSAAQ
jgi:hypothetical protein